MENFKIFIGNFVNFLVLTFVLWYLYTKGKKIFENIKFTGNFSYFIKNYFLLLIIVCLIGVVYFYCNRTVSLISILHKVSIYEIVFGMKIVSVICMSVFMITYALLISWGYPKEKRLENIILYSTGIYILLVLISEIIQLI